MPKSRVKGGRQTLSRNSGKTNYLIHGSAMKNSSVLIAMLLLSGCGVGPLNTICQINYVQSHSKDTAKTIEQNAANNGTLQGVGCPFKTLYSLP